MKLEKIYPLIRKLEQTPKSLAGLGGLFVLIVLARNFLEAISSPRPDGQWPDGITFFFHYPLAYLGTILVIIIMLYSITKEPIGRLARLTVWGLSMLCLAPVIDLILTFGRGWTMSYIFIGGRGLLVDFFTFFGPLQSSGITLGIRLELLAGLIMCFLFVWHKTKRFWRALAGALLVYCIIFTFSVMPSLLVLISGQAAWLGLHQNLITTLKESLNQASFIGSQWRLNSGNPFSEFGLQFSVLMSQFYLVLSALLALFVAFKISAKKIKEVLKNGRWLRQSEILIFFSLGLIIASAGQNIVIGTLPNMISLATAVITIIAACFFAIATNDLSDQKLDALTNPQRPLVQGKLSRGDLYHLALISALFALGGGLLLGFWPFVFILAFQTLYALYSLPPVRLKRIFLLGNIAVGLALGCIIIFGLSLFNNQAPLNLVQQKIILILFAQLLLGAPFKDLKDISGDRQGGVPTLPVFFGDKTGKIMVAVLTIIASLLPTIFFHSIWLLAFGLAGMIAMPFFIFRKPFSEKPVLISGLIYFIILGIVLPGLLTKATS
jgi:4-hydroxybenzoate polyprenyltransferase